MTIQHRPSPLDVDDLDNDFVLTGEDVWIRVQNIAICIHPTDEGVVVDMWAQGQEQGDPLGTTYAFYAEAEDTEDDE